MNHSARSGSQTKALSFLITNNLKETIPEIINHTCMAFAMENDSVLVRERESEREKSRILLVSWQPLALSVPVQSWVG